MIEVGQDTVGGAVGRGDLPEGEGVGDGVEDGEAEELAVGLPPEPEGTSGKGGVDLRGAAGDGRKVEVVAVGVEDAAVVRHPGGVVGEYIADTKG